MTSQSCRRCLLRSSTSAICLRGYGNPLLPVLHLTSIPFSTTAAPRKAFAPAKAMVKTGANMLKKAVVKPRTPNPGERRAMRKRIVLSNGNALEVPGMYDLTPNNLTDEATVGVVMGLQNDTVDSLRAAEAFKPSQTWGLFRRPGLLVRAESIELARILADAETTKEAARLVIDGGKECGKSMLLLHALAMGFLKKWIVINIPEAQALTLATTPYAPIEGTTNPRLYSQPKYVANLLSQIVKANQGILDSLEITQKHDLPVPLQSNISLLRLCQTGADDPEIAWRIYLAFWAEITSEGRPPVLFALDGLNHFMKYSKYRSPEFELIFAQELAFVNHFSEYHSGRQRFPNGGAIIAATNRSHGGISKSMDWMINQQLGRQLGLEEEDLIVKDPWEKTYNLRAEQALEGVKVLMLRGVSKDEARGLMEYWARSGLFRGKVDEKSVVEKWLMAGHGVVGEMENVALEMRIAS